MVIEETAGPSATALRASGRDDGNLRAELIGLRLVVMEGTAGPSTTRATAARSGRDDGGLGLVACSTRPAGLGSLRQVVGGGAVVFFGAAVAGFGGRAEAAGSFHF